MAKRKTKKALRSVAGKGLRNPKSLTNKEAQSLAGHELGHPAKRKKARKAPRRISRRTGRR